MRIEVERLQDVCVLRISGHLLAGEDQEFLRAKSDEVKSQDCNKVLADLRELVSVGSTGVGFLLGIYASVAQRTGGRFVLVGPRPLVSKVFDVTHLTSVLPVAKDFESGLAQLRDEAQSV